MEAIILAGGFGTRLAHIVNDVPKPMAPVAGQPFLKYVMDDLIKKGITKTVMAVGYKKEKIMDYFGQKYKGCKVIYSEEDEPLFTGGAIKKALKKCQDENIFIVNGDTFFDVNLLDMLDNHRKNNSELTIATKRMKNFDRYGTIIEDNGKIINFIEKKKQINGIINGGIYLIQKDLLLTFQNEKFSFETEFMEKKVNVLKIYSYLSTGYFIDIGIPEDYLKAQLDFSIGAQHE